jgi:hypothetical protein
MLHTKQALENFADLSLDKKQVKIYAISVKLANIYPFYTLVRDMFDEFGTKISENILDYIYAVTMKLVDVSQNSKILSQEMQNLQKLKKSI